MPNQVEKMEAGLYVLKMNRNGADPLIFEIEATELPDGDFMLSFSDGSKVLWSEYKTILEGTDIIFRKEI
jgi:hypothetical protein